MSFLGLGGGASNASSSSMGSINPQRIDVAVAELEMITDIFNRVVSSCHTKCINQRYAEGDLNKGESVCIDRCVAKFFEVNKKVGERMQQMGGAAAAAPGGQTTFGL
ncbi:protein transporter tim10 [Tulasnella sp. 403]|nr:protein transporter tim10 [Tulasnella sp. 403]